MSRISLVLLVLLIGCQQEIPPSSTALTNAEITQAKGDVSESDRAAFEQMFTQWGTSLDAADAEAHNRLFFTEDAVIIPPNGEPSIGEGNLEQVLTLQRPTGSEISNPEIEVTGDWALIRANFSTTWEPVNEGESFQENSRYIWVLRRQLDQSWKIARFIFYPLP